jgi:cell division transport system ATP-binding protein
MIRFDQVYKRYPGYQEALQNINFEIIPGEIVFVTGASGAGKSTLLKVLSSIEKPSSGTVMFENYNLSQAKDKTLNTIRKKFGMVFQDHKLLYDRNCYENVALPLAVNNIFGNEANKRIRAALDKVGLLNKERMMPITLSGGEQQRLAIARAIVCRPAIITADEPTGNLDKAYANEIMNIFLSFHQVGVTVIISTHELPNIPVKFKHLHLANGLLSSNNQRYAELPA